MLGGWGVSGDEERLTSACVNEQAHVSMRLHIVDLLFLVSSPRLIAPKLAPLQSRARKSRARLSNPLFTSSPPLPPKGLCPVQWHKILHHTYPPCSPPPTFSAHTLRPKLRSATPASRPPSYSALRAISKLTRGSILRRKPLEHVRVVLVVGWT